MLLYYFLVHNRTQWFKKHPYRGLIFCNPDDPNFSTQNLKLIQLLRVIVLKLTGADGKGINRMVNSSTNPTLGLGTMMFN